LKSRLIIGALVGIIVTIGVVVTSPKSARAAKVAFDLVRSEAAQAEAWMDGLAVRIADARMGLASSGGPTDGLDEVEPLLVLACERFGQIVQAPTLRQAGLLLIDARQTLRRARAGRSPSPPEPSRDLAAASV
jgi:hypothetical protein